MKSLRASLLLLATLTLYFGTALDAGAQVPRAFVSSIGKDTGACDTTDKPCRSVNTALAQIQPGGEVVILDSGSYAPFTLNKSASVVAAPGAHVSINAQGHGAFISGLGLAITLRGLNFTGAGGSDGIHVVGSGAFQVERCKVTNFSNGILFTGPSAASNHVSVKESAIRDCNANGIVVSGSDVQIVDTDVARCAFAGIRYFGPANTAGELTVKGVSVLGCNEGIGIDSLGSVKAMIDRCRVEKNERGITIGDNARVAIHNTAALGNDELGIHVVTSGTPAEVMVEDCIVANNHGGILAQSFNGGTAVVRVSNTTIVHNAEGGGFSGSGSLISFGNNRIAGNAVGPFFNSTIQLQ